MPFRAHRSRKAAANLLVHQQWLSDVEIHCINLCFLQKEIRGSEFTSYARANGMYEPHDDHCWVGLSSAVFRAGYADRVHQTASVDKHNHMSKVWVYHSKLFNNPTARDNAILVATSGAAGLIQAAKDWLASADEE